MIHMSQKIQHNRVNLAIAVLTLVAVILLPTVIRAQGTDTPQGVPVEITGQIAEISGATIVVAGLTVDVTNASLDSSVTVGTTVTVVGQLANNVIVAQTVIIQVGVVAPTPAPENTAEVTPDATSEVTATDTPAPSDASDVIIVIEGPVVNIVTNIITIYDINITVEPQDPILNIIDIGDVIRVEGNVGASGVVVANVVSNISNVIVSGATVGLEGPVESIDGNIIVVNSVPVQLALTDPLLQTVKVGDFVSVAGNFEGSGANIVLVVVNIVVVNNVVIVGNPLCWYHETGMGMGMGMGHWHCDGMGMGMGMGDAMGMGMGQ
jgi:hypothetical protein